MRRKVLTSFILKFCHQQAREIAYELKLNIELIDFHIENSVSAIVTCINRIFQYFCFNPREKRFSLVSPNVFHLAVDSLRSC